MFRAIAIGSALVGAAYGASLENCGTSSDVMQNVKISLSPDPPKANKDFTMTMTGDLGATFSSGSLTANMDISVLGQSIPIATTTMLSVSPGIKAGAQALKLGPFKFPKLPLGIKPIINGNLTIHDSGSKQVSCLKFNSFPVFQSDPAALPEPVKDDPVELCSAASDHLKDVKFSSANGITTINGTLDEDITAGELDIDLSISINLFEDISINLNIDTPFSYTPGFMKGPLSVVLGPSRYYNHFDAASTGISGSVKGTIKAKDSSSEEIFCLKLDVEPSSASTGVYIQ